eukprot:COSAG01_NODE_33263_length_567_cov_0.970085_1_plen_35_part_10
MFAKNAEAMAGILCHTVAALTGDSTMCNCGCTPGG